MKHATKYFRQYKTLVKIHTEGDTYYGNKYEIVNPSRFRIAHYGLQRTDEWQEIPGEIKKVELISILCHGHQFEKYFLKRHPGWEFLNHGEWDDDYDVRDTNGILWNVVVSRAYLDDFMTDILSYSMEVK